MYASEDYDGWNLQVATVAHGGFVTAIAVINRGNLEFRFEDIGEASTETASAARAISWLRGWLDLNQLSDQPAVQRPHQLYQALTNKAYQSCCVSPSAERKSAT